MEISPPPLTEAEQLSNFAYSTSSGAVVKRDFTQSVKSDNRYGSNWAGVNMMKLSISSDAAHDNVRVYVLRAESISKLCWNIWPGFTIKTFTYMNNINNIIYIQKSAYNLRQTILFVHSYWLSTTLYSYKMQLK